MKGFRIIAVLALLNAGGSNAGADGGTNHVAEPVRNLLDTAGYTFAQKTRILSRQDTNSLRNVHFIERGPFRPLTVPAKPTAWSLWNNSSFKHVGRYTDQGSGLAPDAAIAQYEYDLSYTFHF